MDTALELRSALDHAKRCSFEAQIEADYGDKTYSFALSCETDVNGDLLFSVVSPDSISGIAGKLSENGGKLTFDDVALAFPMLADGQLSPVSAPWFFYHTLRRGYITSAGEVDGKIRLIVDDSYRDDALTLHIWLSEEKTPSFVEIYFKDRRILSMTVSNYQIV